MKISYYLSKLFPFYGIIYNKIKYPKIHFEIGSFVEILNNGGIFKYGQKLKIGSGTRIYLTSKDKILNIGNNVDISRQSFIYPDKIMIGNNVDIQDNVRIYGNVKIGDSVIIAPNVFIASGTHIFNKDKDKTILEQDKLYKIDRPIEIESDVWIGINCVILPGVKIAKGCVIGAGSIVTKNTESYSVYVGNPAKKIKNRY